MYIKRPDKKKEGIKSLIKWVTQYEFKWYKMYRRMALHLMFHAAVVQWAFKLQGNRKGKIDNIGVKENKEKE